MRKDFSGLLVWFEQSRKVHPGFIRSCEIKITQHWETLESRLIPPAQLLSTMTGYTAIRRGHQPGVQGRRLRMRASCLIVPRPNIQLRLSPNHGWYKVSGWAGIWAQLGSEHGAMGPPGGRDRLLGEFPCIRCGKVRASNSFKYTSINSGWVGWVKETNIKRENP